MSLAKRCVKKYEDLAYSRSESMFSNLDYWKVGNFIKQIMWMLILPIAGYASFELFELNSNPGMQVIVQNILLLVLCILTFRIRFKSTTISTLNGPYMSGLYSGAIIKVIFNIIMPLSLFWEVFIVYPPQIIIITTLPLTSFVISSIWPYCLIISYIVGSMSGIAFASIYGGIRFRKWYKGRVERRKNLAMCDD